MNSTPEEDSKNADTTLLSCLTAVLNSAVTSLGSARMLLDITPELLASYSEPQIKRLQRRLSRCQHFIYNLKLDLAASSLSSSTEKSGPPSAQEIKSPKPLRIEDLIPNKNKPIDT